MGWLGWFLDSRFCEAEIKVSAGQTLSRRLWEEASSSLIRCWQNPVSCGCRTKVPPSFVMVSWEPLFTWGLSLVLAHGFYISEPERVCGILFTLGISGLGCVASLLTSSSSMLDLSDSSQRRFNALKSSCDSNGNTWKIQDNLPIFRSLNLITLQSSLPWDVTYSQDPGISM